MIQAFQNVRNRFAKFCGIDDKMYRALKSMQEYTTDKIHEMLPADDEHTVFKLHWTMNKWAVGEIEKYLLTIHDGLYPVVKRNEANEIKEFCMEMIGYQNSIGERALHLVNQMPRPVCLPPHEQKLEERAEPLNASNITKKITDIIDSVQEKLSQAYTLLQGAILERLDNGNSEDISKDLKKINDDSESVINELRRKAESDFFQQVLSEIKYFEDDKNLLEKKVSKDVVNELMNELSLTYRIVESNPSDRLEPIPEENPSDDLEPVPDKNDLILVNFKFDMTKLKEKLTFLRTLQPPIRSDDVQPTTVEFILQKILFLLYKDLAVFAQSYSVLVYGQFLDICARLNQAENEKTFPFLFVDLINQMKTEEE